MGWSFVPSTKIAITKQKIDFWPQISKFWGQKSTFSPLAANLSPTDQCFQHEKGVSLESRYEGTKIFTPCPQKIGFWAKKWPNLVQNLHFWSFWAKYCHFLHILSNVRPKNNVNKVPRWVFCYVGNQTFDFSSKKKDFFAPKRPNLAQNWHFWLIWARPCRLIQCPVVGRLVVVARGLYLARHLFTLFDYFPHLLQQQLRR